ncbi:glycosyltransferase [Tenacibaculum sp.]|nr:glycosyltransferase [Tenacibaculum sp.]
MIINILLYTFVTVAAIQIVYYLCFSFFAFSKEKKTNNNSVIPVSIIICVKNKASKLKEFLPSIINQNHSNFEIVLINNASYDDTLEVMEAFEKDNKNINIVNVKNTEAFWGNKKYALTLGIKAASNEHLLFTDPDCKPLSNNWVEIMSRQFTNNKTIVLGYRKYVSKKYSFINLLARFDVLITSIQYFSYAKLGIPYMGVGENLAYTKSDFFKTNGYIKHMNFRFGHDTLFIQDAANSSNTSISTSFKSFTVSDAPKTVKEWFHNKRVYYSSLKRFKFSHKLLLKVFLFSKALFFVLSILLLFLLDWKIIVPIIAVYLIIQYVVIGFSAKKLKETKVLLYLPFLEICLILFHFIIFITHKFIKPSDWK